MKRRFLFSLVAVLLLLVALEGLARLTYRLTIGHAYVAPAAAEAPPGLVASNLASESPVPSWMEREVIHPYLGYLGVDNAQEWQTRLDTMLPDSDGARQDNTLRVALLGGSVASNLKDSLTEALTRAVPGRRIRLTNLAFRGYKQPQQWMALSWALSRGAKFDMVINLDGYNELQLPFTDNQPNGIEAHYPRQWAQRVRRAPSMEALALTGQSLWLRNEQARVRQRLSVHALRHSALVGIYFEMQLAALKRQRARSELEMRGLSSENPRLETHGLFDAKLKGEALLAELNAHWLRCGKLLARLSQASGMEYYGVLQPMKDLAGREPDVAPAKAGMDWDLVRQGYLRLRTMGKELNSSGGRFLDAIPVFTKANKHLFADNCHLKPEGRLILARWIAAQIVQHSRLPMQ